MRPTLDSRFTLTDKEQRYRRACRQIIVLHQRLGDVHKRYKRAKQANSRAVSLRLIMQLSALENVRHMYIEYAHRRADEIVQLRGDLFGEVVAIPESSDTE